MYFALLPVLDKSSISYPYPVNFFLNTVPSFLFFTGFLIVLFLWYALCSEALRVLLIGADATHALACSIPEAHMQSLTATSTRRCVAL